MTPSKLQVPVPALALEPVKAAAALGVGLTVFTKQIAPELRVVRLGSKRLYPVAELQAWLDRHAQQTLGGAA